MYVYVCVWLKKDFNKGSKRMCTNAKRNVMGKEKQVNYGSKVNARTGSRSFHSHFSLY